MEWFNGKDAAFALQEAIDSDSPAAVAATVRAGASVNAKGLRGVTPLEYAICHFRKNAYAELLRQHANTAQRDDEGDNAMTLATNAFAKDRDYLLLALRAGGDSNTLRPDKDPIIIRFINDRNVEAIRLMKQNGADIDIRGRTNRPLIITAGLMEYWDVVWCLLELGARFDYEGEPITMERIFKPSDSTPPDSPLWPFKVKSWKFLREHGVQLPDISLGH